MSGVWGRHLGDWVAAPRHAYPARVTPNLRFVGKGSYPVYVGFRQKPAHQLTRGSHPMFRTLKSPQRAGNLARWTFNIVAPTALAVLVGWLSGVIPGGERLLATYVTLLFISVMSAAVAMLAAGQLAIHEAFSAGFQTGQASVFPDDPETAPPTHGRHSRSGRSKDPLLRLVD